MKRVSLLACALVCASGLVFAAGETTATQAAAPAKDDKVATQSRSELQMEAYKAVGVSAENIAKLKELDQKMRDARAKGEQVDRKAMTEERAKFLTDEQRQKVREYMQQHGGGWGGGRPGGPPPGDSKAPQ
jgi:hypothetical protein